MYTSFDPKEALTCLSQPANVSLVLGLTPSLLHRHTPYPMCLNSITPSKWNTSRRCVDFYKVNLFQRGGCVTRHRSLGWMCITEVRIEISEAWEGGQLRNKRNCVLDDIKCSFWELDQVLSNNYHCILAKEAKMYSLLSNLEDLSVATKRGQTIKKCFTAQESAWSKDDRV